jgi:hypothetical protein
MQRRPTVAVCERPVAGHGMSDASSAGSRRERGVLRCRGESEQSAGAPIFVSKAKSRGQPLARYEGLDLRRCASDDDGQLRRNDEQIRWMGTAPSMEVGTALTGAPQAGHSAVGGGEANWPVPHCRA